MWDLDGQPGEADGRKKAVFNKVLFLHATNISSNPQHCIYV